MISALDHDIFGMYRGERIVETVRQKDKLCTLRLLPLCCAHCVRQDHTTSSHLFAVSFASWHKKSDRNI